MKQILLKECNLLFYAIVIGFGFSFLYDQLLICRRLIKHHKLVIFFEDMFYLLFCFFISFCLLFYGNDGVLRFYMILGCALGITLYFVTVGKFYQNMIYRLIMLVMYPLGVVKNRLTKIAFQFKMKMRKSLSTIERKEEEHATRSKNKKNKTKVSKKKK